MKNYYVGCLVIDLFVYLGGIGILQVSKNQNLLGGNVNDVGTASQNSGIVK